MYNKCNKPCGCKEIDPCKCKEVDPCGCVDLDVCGCESTFDLLCAFYSGEELSPLAITAGMDGNLVIKIINDYIRDYLTGSFSNTIIESVGDKVAIYKGLSSMNRHQIKSIDGLEGIKVVDKGDYVEISIDPEWLSNNVIFENVGEGVSVYKGLISGKHQLRKIKSSDNSISVSLDVDESINIVTDYKVIESEDVGEGVSLRKNLNAKKIGIRTLESDDFIITEQTNGGIKISSPGGGSTSNDLYLDVNFIRPTNWSSKAETINGVKTAKGTLNDPFLSYEEYLRRRIGETGGSNAYGLYSKVNPKIPVAVLQILSNVQTSSDIEVNNTTLKLKNRSSLIYTGTRDYAIDYKTIYDLMDVDVNGKSKLPTYHIIVGEGLITRTTGFGIIRGKVGSKTRGGGVPAFALIGEGDRGLIILEGENIDSYVPVFKADGVTRLMNGGDFLWGWKQPPTTPLITIEGVGVDWWSAEMNGTTIMVITKTQVGVELTSKATLTGSANNFMYQVDNRFFGYEKKLLDTASFTTEERDMVNFFSPVAAQNPGVFYKPYNGYSIFKVGEECQLRIENISTQANSFHGFKAMNTVELMDKSTFSNLVSFSDIGGGGTINLLKKYGDYGYFGMIDGKSTNQYYNLAEGDTTNSIVLHLKNMILTSKNYSKDFIGFEVQPGGTLTTINGRAVLSQLPIYVDNTAALVDLLRGMLYINTTTNSLTQVI